MPVQLASNFCPILPRQRRESNPVKTPSKDGVFALKFKKSVIRLACSHRSPDPNKYKLHGFPKVNNAKRRMNKLANVFLTKFRNNPARVRQNGLYVLVTDVRHLLFYVVLLNRLQIVQRGLRDA